MTTDNERLLYLEYWMKKLRTQMDDHNHGGVTPGVPPASAIDHGSLAGLADDDHTQYLNTTRHDTTSRHALGTVVPHDAHNSTTGMQGGTVGEYFHLTNAQVSGLHAAVTVTDTATIDLALTGQEISATLKDTAVTPGSYTLANITIDAQGRITAASSGTVGGGVAHNDTTGKQGGTTGEYYHLTSAELAGLHAAVTVADTTTIDLALTGQEISATLKNTTVTPGSYTLANITIDAQGRITAASNGAAPVTSVSGTAPISSSGGTTPTISISAATGAAAGSMSAADKTKLDYLTLAAATSITGGGTLALGGYTLTVPGTGTAVLSTDSRLSDARTPTAHATSHKTGGSDAIKLDELAAPTDVTTLNASLTAHGLLPKLGGGTTNFLRADGTWATPPGTGVTSVAGTAPISSSGGATPTISISAATGAAAGSMSAADKTKLDYLTLAAATSITGGGTLALGGYTLTVPGTGTAVLGSGTAGRVAYWDSANSIASNTLITLDTTNRQVGINTSSPGTSHLYIAGASGKSLLTMNTASSTDADRAMNFDISGTNYAKILVPVGSGGALAFWTGSGAGVTERFRISSTGNLSITQGSLTFKEMTAPSSPASDEVVLYAQDDGGGKTRLMAKFSNGSTVQIAIST